MYSIEQTIEVSATPAAILAALTTKAGIRGWFTDHVECDSAAQTARFRFYKASGPAMDTTFHLDAMDETRVAMTCVGAVGCADWLGTKLEYRLAPGRVTLVHSGWQAKDEGYAMVTKGWTMYLGSLRAYLETGKGDPHRYGKEVVLRWEEQFKNQANIAITDELMADNFVHQLPFPGLPPGREGLKAAGQGIFRAFAHEHLKVKVEVALATDDRVITRTRVRALHTGEWNGIPATNREVGWTETTLYRLEGGKIVEMIAEGNFLGLVAQLTAK